MSCPAARRLITGSREYVQCAVALVRPLRCVARRQGVGVPLSALSLVAPPPARAAALPHPRQALRKCVKRAVREVSKQNSGKKSKPLEHFALPFTHINERIGATLTHQMLLAAEPDYTSIATLCEFALLSPLERLLWASDPVGRSFAALERMSAHDVINTAITELSLLSATVMDPAFGHLSVEQLQQMHVEFERDGVVDIVRAAEHYVLPSQVR
jgi:hypothetical protein